MPNATRVGLLLWAFATAAACGGGSGDAPDAANGPDAGSGAGAVTVDVETDRGPVHGAAEGDLVIFRGVPFAAPPTGARRFAPPALADAWTAPLAATAFGPACPQGQANLTNQSEDCLRLNVWAHAAVPAPRPVIVWIHGGGYVEGDSSELAYDGASLATHADVVVVSINYRLGVLGFLATPQLVAPDGGTGNWGLRDQIAALGWVQRNAAAFGGDPTHVMIAGESAGGISICTLLAAPPAQGLYAAAAMESGTCRAVLNPHTTNGTWPSADTVGVDTAVALGCTSGDIAACLRAQPAAAILAAQGGLPASIDLGFPVGSTIPVVDGVTLDQRPFAAIGAGRGAVPLIIGSNRDDASGFTIPLGITNAAGQFDKYLGALGLGAKQAALDALYPVATLTELGAATAFATDVAFACPSAQVVAARTAPTYLYELDRGFTTGVLAQYGATHGLEVAYLFDTLASWGTPATADDAALTATMQAAWGALARGAAPTGWTAATGTSPSYLSLAAASTVQTGWRGDRCAQLATLGLLAE